MLDLWRLTLLQNNYTIIGKALMCASNLINRASRAQNAANFMKVTKAALGSPIGSVNGARMPLLLRLQSHAVATCHHGALLLPLEAGRRCGLEAWEAGG